MRKLLPLLAAFLALALPAEARAIGQCGLPSSEPVWIDFGDGSVPFWELFAREGNVVAAAGTLFPQQIRDRGSKTVFFDRHLNNRVGTPSAPKEADTIEGRAHKLFDYAAQSAGCDKPLIALNELFGASLETPWSGTNTQYRANVLTFIRTLSARGARPLLLISSAPYTAGEAGDWWREAAKYADLVPEVYFAAPTVSKLGPTVGNRRLRTTMRRAVRNFTALGIPASKLGIMLGFQTGRGAGGREGLEAQAWYETVKWQALAARQVASETRIATVWSWGWATYGSTTPDPDKEVAACVYLWTRNHSLCDGPAAAGPDLDTSLTEGQIRLAPGQQCSLGSRTIQSGTLAALQRLTGDREVAFTTLLARLAESPHERVSTTRMLAAERAVVALRFGGSTGAYRAALARTGATIAIARAALGDELRRFGIESRLRARLPSAREISVFYFSYPELLTRAVEATPGPWWLGDRTRGLAFQSLAPEPLFALPTGRRTTLRALDAIYAIRILGDVLPLGSVAFSEAKPAIAAALSAFARRGAFEDWTVARQEGSLRSIICRGDDLPAPGTVRLSGYLPFLSLTG